MYEQHIGLQYFHNVSLFQVPTGISRRVLLTDGSKFPIGIAFQSGSYNLPSPRMHFSSHLKRTYLYRAWHDSNESVAIYEVNILHSDINCRNLPTQWAPLLHELPWDSSFPSPPQPLLLFPCLSSRTPAFLAAHLHVLTWLFGNSGLHCLLSRSSLIVCMCGAGGVYLHFTKKSLFIFLDSL